MQRVALAERCFAEPGSYQRGCALRPRLCSAPLRKSYALRCVRGTQGVGEHKRKHLTGKCAARSMRAKANETPRESFVAYSDTQLFINGTWRPSHSGRTIDVLNPATEQTIGTVAQAARADLDEVLAARSADFKVWRGVSPVDRCKVMVKASSTMRVT